MTNIRFKFIRGESLRFISHLDQQRLFQRALRRAEIPVAYSQGFNPHIKLSFALAMSVTLSSQCEYADITLKTEMSCEEFKMKLNRTLPHGLKIVDVYYIAPGSKSLTASIVECTYLVKVTLLDSIEQSIIEKGLHELLEKSEIIINKRNKKGRYISKDIRPFLKNIVLVEMLEEEVTVKIVVKYVEQESIKPEVLLGCIDEEIKKVLLLDPTIYVERYDMKLAEG